MLKNPVQYICISAELAEQRIDNFLFTRLKGVPKSHVYRILRKGEVRVNKKRVQPTYRLRADDQVRLPPIQLVEQEQIAPSASLRAYLSTRILYEDSHFLVMNKPAGIPVHGGSGVSVGVIEALRHMYPTIKDLELVHRLDRDTSGCLVLAKKRSALREMHALLREGHVKKIYQALTKGHWKASEQRVDAPLRKNSLSSGERIVKVHPEGKPSRTLFNPQQTYPTAMLVEVLLETGRTHQIRVHATYRKHPVAGDDKYGDPVFNQSMRAFGLKRLFLHASLIEWTMPSSQKMIKIMAPIDDDLRSCLKALELTASSA